MLGELLDKARSDVERHKRDLLIIKSKLNRAKVLRDMRCTNLFDDGKGIWLLDFDASIEKDTEFIMTTNGKLVEQLVGELNDWFQQEQRPRVDDVSESWWSLLSIQESRYGIDHGIAYAV